jgi:hypothetical protein
LVTHEDGPTQDDIVDHPSDADPVSDQAPDTPPILPPVDTSTLPPAPAKDNPPTPPPTGPIRPIKGLQDFEKDFLQREQQRMRVDLTPEKVQEIWQEYSEQVSSPSLRQFLQEAEIQVEEGRLTVLIGTQMAKGMIQQESGLIEQLRERLGHHDLSMFVEIDPTKAPTTSTADNGPSTPKEIFEHMAAKNELLYELRRRFDLTIDTSSL